MCWIQHVDGHLGKYFCFFFLRITQNSNLFKTHTNCKKNSFKQNVWNSRCNTSATISKAITNAVKKPDVFVNVSGVSLYKPDANKTYTENDSGESYDFMSRLCIEWEKAATLPKNIETRSIRMRSGVVIGREGGMIQSMYLPFWLGLGGPIGDGRQTLPWIHIIDLCELIKYCIETPSVKSGPINGVAPEIVTNNEFSQQFATTLNRPAAFSVPEYMINLVYGKERAALLTTGAKIKPERAEIIGYNYQYPNIKEACHEVVYHA